MRCVRLAVFAGFVLSSFSFSSRSQGTPAGIPQDSGQAPQHGFLVLPAGTTVSIALTRAVWMKSAKVGDVIYAVTTFPVSVDNHMAIPTGTYVSGVIDALTKPGRFSSHAEFRVHFTRLVFSNGYTVFLDSVTGTAPAAVAAGRIQVAFNSELLLDNGAPMDMNLANGLELDASRVAGANGLSHTSASAQFGSAIHCVPTPGTPGTPGQVIPGTPGTPGTPPTVIPGGPGMPPTVIPGTPGTPGTPTTIIPGTPGTPGTVCPGPPVVLPTSAARPDHLKSFTITTPVMLSGVPLISGTYRITWAGLGPEAPVDITRNGKLVVHTQAHIVGLTEKSVADGVESVPTSNGTLVLNTIRFSGETIAVSFAN